MGYKVVMLLGLSGLLMVMAVDQNQADAVCCHGKKICRGKMFLRKCSTWCEDGTQPDPDCGVGKCDSDGCNCDGGCRRSMFRAVEDPEEARGFVESLEGGNAMPGRGVEHHDAGEELVRLAEETLTLLELLRRDQENIAPGESARSGREFGDHNTDKDMKLSKEEALEMLKKLGEVDFAKDLK